MAKLTARLMNVTINSCGHTRPTRTEEEIHILSNFMDRGNYGDRILSLNVYTSGALMSVMVRAWESNGALIPSRLMKEEYIIDSNSVVILLPHQQENVPSLLGQTLP